MADERNTPISERLQRLIPLDRRRLLDAGCGRGVGTAEIARGFPRTSIVGADVGADFIDRATAEFGDDRVKFAVEDFGALSFADGEFDCVHADNSLEHAFDIDVTLAEIYRVLDGGGCLVAALPPDGLNPHRTCDNHTWKTIPSDVRARLAAAGFRDIELTAVDIYRELLLPPFPPSNDQMLYVRAWKRRPDADPVERVVELTRWAYTTLDP